MTYPADVLPAFVAEMDFGLAPPVKAALEAAIARDDCGYAQPHGFGEAVARFAKTRFDWHLDSERVFLVPDVMAGIAEALRLLTGPQDPVVINPPVYPPFFYTLNEVQRPILEVPLLRSIAGYYEIDFDALERAFAGGARVYLFCNPHNPVGRVFERDVVERIARLARTYDVLVIADEIHGPLTLPGAAHTPFVSLAAELTERAITLTAASKAFNIAGLKCAALVAGSDALRRRLLDLPIEVAYRAGILGVLGSIAAFNDGMPWLRELVAYLDDNRRYLADLLAEELPAIRYVQPEAGYLAWLDCSELVLGDNPSRTFLKRGRVALSRGRDFGKEGEQYVRLNMGTSRDLLREIVRRMKLAVTT
ncbi:MAG: MalY/PatB family protein [Vulcanimicrobiaceae bacterium]